MCSCDLILANEVESFDLGDGPHTFSYSHEKTGMRTLLAGLHVEGKADFAAAYKVEGQFGLKRGYVLVLGEKA